MKPSQKGHQDVPIDQTPSDKADHSGYTTVALDGYFSKASH